MEEQRISRLKQFMSDHDITWRAIGEQFGISAQAAMYMLHNETVIPLRHEKLVELGFPLDTLPISMERSRTKIPRFPGLAGV